MSIDHPLVEPDGSVHPGGLPLHPVLRRTLIVAGLLVAAGLLVLLCGWLTPAGAHASPASGSADHGSSGSSGSSSGPKPSKSSKPAKSSSGSADHGSSGGRSHSTSPKPTSKKPSSSGSSVGVSADHGAGAVNSGNPTAGHSTEKTSVKKTSVKKTGAAKSGRERSTSDAKPVEYKSPNVVKSVQHKTSGLIRTVLRSSAVKSFEHDITSAVKRADTRATSAKGQKPHSALHQRKSSVGVSADHGTGAVNSGNPTAGYGQLRSHAPEREGRSEHHPTSFLSQAEKVNGWRGKGKDARDAGKALATETKAGKKVTKKLRREASKPRYTRLRNAGSSAEKKLSQALEDAKKGKAGRVLRSAGRGAKVVGRAVPFAGYVIDGASTGESIKKDMKRGMSAQHASEREIGATAIDYAVGGVCEAATEGVGTAGCAALTASGIPGKGYKAVYDNPAGHADLALIADVALRGGPTHQHLKKAAVENWKEGKKLAKYGWKQGKNAWNSQPVADARHAVSSGAKDVKDFASDKADDAKDFASDKADDVKDGVSKGVSDVGKAAKSVNPFD